MSKYILVKDYTHLEEFVDADKLYACFTKLGNLDWTKKKSLAVTLEKEDAVNLVKILNYVTDDINFSLEPINEFYTIQDVEHEYGIRYLNSHVMDSYRLYDSLEVTWTTHYEKAVRVDYETAEKYVNVIKVVFDINADIVRTDLDVLT